MDMSYEIVTLEAKTVVGLSARTKTDSPDCGAVIGGLWQKLFEEGVYFAVPNKADDRTIGMYDAYVHDMTGP